MKIVITVLAVLAVLVLGAVAVAYSGFVSVAATDPGSAPVEWFLNTTREHSIESQLDGIEVPSLDDPAKLRTGLVHYHQMCVTCHGAPGIEPDELAQGLNPTPPELAKRRRRAPAGPAGGEAGEGREANERETEHAAETYWIVKNGIRMTGMPAFGPTHSDEQIWAITAFVERLPELSADEYASMVRNAGLSLRSSHEEDEHGEMAGEAMDEMHDEMQNGAMHDDAIHGDAMDDPGDAHRDDDGHEHPSG